MDKTNPLLMTTREYWSHLSSAWKDVERSLDKERVHKLRVATRRLTAALTLLHSILENDRILKVRRRFKKLLGRLGPLRDVQVQISIVDKWQRGNLIEEFAGRLKRIEKKECRRVLERLTASHRKRLRRSLKDLELKVSPALQAFAPGALEEKVRTALEAERTRVKSAKDNLRASSDSSSLHAARIATKKLRYSLEAASPVVGVAPPEEMEVLRGYQTRLGDIRDLQILAKELRNWSEKHNVAHDTAIASIQAT